MKATNLLYVRRNTLGFFAQTELLCASCGARQDCTLRATLRCAHYIPTLKFRDLSGTEGEFATFRSPSWAKVLAIGQPVAICSNDLTVSRIAHVLATYIGKREEMEQRFGARSHLSVGKEFDLAAFRKERRRTLGNRLYEAMQNVSVILLR